jgi:hypothetical protein
MPVQLAEDQPGFASLAVDSLGKDMFSANAHRSFAKPEEIYELSHVGSTFAYRASGTAAQTPPLLTFEYSARRIHPHSHFAGGNPLSPLVLNSYHYDNHAALVGDINEDGSVKLPVLLHMLDLGTFRITS